MSSTISRRLSVPELSQRILMMAKTGVYRESIFAALHPLATKKNIRLAIAQAKQFGLHSVAALRDDELGTYYQVDLTQYQSGLSYFRAASQWSQSLTDLTQASAIIVQLQRRLRWLVWLSWGGAIALLVLAIASSGWGYGPWCGGLLLGAGIMTLIGVLQHQLAKFQIFPHTQQES
ncbi:MAG: hypothetical protein F6K30_28960 [Cyanothece sp. SIO2G6]|nr:hypothetical protein [Cyanothece sp. SIO2G6]